MIDSDDHESQQDGALLASSSLPWYKYHQRILLAAASSIAIVLVVFFLTALFASVNVHGSASSDNSIVSPGSIVHLSASTVDSWNGWVCSTYSWDLSGPTSTRQLKGKDVAYNVTSSDSFTTATVSCKNSFGTSLGTSSKVSWYVGIAKDTAVQVTDPSEIVQCPTQNKVDPTTGELKVSTTSSLANLDADTALYSSECNGFVVKLLQPPNASTGIAPYTLNTSLEDIFYSLSAPPISIPYTAVNVDENSSSSSSSKATRKLSAFKLVNEQNWNLPYSSQFISGSALFNELVWSVDTTLQSLEYADGSFKGVTWHASTSITIDVVFTAVISTGSVDAKITLVNVNTPPVVLPVPGLEFITVNTDFSVDLKLTGYSSVVGGSVTAKWSAKCQLDYEWQVTCMNTLTCTGTLLYCTCLYVWCTSWYI